MSMELVSAYNLELLQFLRGHYALEKRDKTKAQFLIGLGMLLCLLMPVLILSHPPYQPGEMWEVFLGLVAAALWSMTGRWMLTRRYEFSDQDVRCYSLRSHWDWRVTFEEVASISIQLRHENKYGFLILEDRRGKRREVVCNDALWRKITAFRQDEGEPVAGKIGR